MRSNFLADDLLKSVGDPKIAMILVKNGAGICKSGGFRLKKFISNNKELLMSIPEDQKEMVKMLSIISPVYKPLGIASPFVLEGRQLLETFRVQERFRKMGIEIKRC